MIKSHMENVIKQEEVVDDVICNMCGKLISENQFEREDYIHIATQWGYFSKKDGESHKFDLCEDCYDKLISQFKVAVDIKHQFRF